MYSMIEYMIEYIRRCAAVRPIGASKKAKPDQVAILLQQGTPVSQSPKETRSGPGQVYLYEDPPFFALKPGVVLNRI